MSSPSVVSWMELALLADALDEVDAGLVGAVSDPPGAVCCSGAFHVAPRSDPVFGDISETNAVSIRLVRQRM